jgi:hypothetical protein
MDEQQAPVRVLAIERIDVAYTIWAAGYLFVAVR